MSTALTIGGWFAQGFVQTLFEKASDSGIQLFAKRRGLQEDLRKLRTSLFMTRAILYKAEMRWKKNMILAELMKELKDIAYDAQDLLEEFEYQILKQKIEDRGDQASDFVSFALIAASELFDDAGNRLRQIQAKLSDIADTMKNIMHMDDGSGRQSDTKMVRRETSSLPTESLVFGRGKEREQLVELLLLASAEESGFSSNKLSFSVLPVVGMGGVGKTSLAQQVYSDDRIGKHFELKIWICVSDNFDAKRLTKEMIESVTKEEQGDLMNLDTLQVTLKEKIAKERFMLVLDDVWSENMEWEKLFAPLRFAGQGSMIIVTTRDMKIANTIGTTKAILLDGLEGDDYWNLFKKYAFGSLIPEEHPELVAIGREIADKLKGSPLAAKTLGSLLQRKLTENHWRTVMESEVWELPQEENGILPVLWLSYQHLPGHLKQCFAICSLFPKGHSFQKRELVQIWMAEGFISAERNKRLEDVGDGYFHDLADKSFFKELCYQEGTYVMHDLIHDLAQFVSLDDCCGIDGDDKSRQLIPDMIRHLSSMLTQLRLLNSSSYGKLRTLVIKYKRNPFLSLKGCLLPDDLFERLRSVRVLILQNCSMKKLPETIANLIHLRYFDICYNDIQSLPESFYRLHNLQTLRMWKCRLQRLPEGMSKLINLREIYAEDEIISEIKSVGKLTCLQKLPMFKVQKQRGHKLEELNGLNQLHGKIRIASLENVESREEASKARLNTKEFLEELELEWASNSSHNPMKLAKAFQLVGVVRLDTRDYEFKTYESQKEEKISSHEILEGLQPHHSLKILTIREYNGAKSPNWLVAQVLSNLETLKLANCYRWEDFSCISQLPHLQILHVNELAKMKQISHGSSDPPLSMFFPRLQEIVLEKMDLLEKFQYLGQLQCLKVIQMKGIPKMKYIGAELLGDAENNLFPRLEVLELNSMLACEELPSLELLPCLKVLCIENMLSLKKIGHEFLTSMDQVKGFARLEKLVFRDMPELDEWYNWANGREVFPCLISLEIYNCPKLKMLPPLPHSLVELKLEDVGLIELPGFQEEMDGSSSDEATSLPKLHVSNINKIQIWKCKNLVRLSYKRFTELTSLEKLSIRDCPELTGMTRNAEIDLPFPPSLEELELSSCGKLDNSLPGILQNLTSLTELCICNYPSMESLPLLHLSRLRTLRICDCGQLKSITGLGVLGYLVTLTIIRCPNLLPDGMSEQQGDRCSVVNLEIDDTAFLNVSPLRNRLPSIFSLTIRNSSQAVMFEREEEELLGSLGSLRMLEFSNCVNLLALPTRLDVLSSLEFFGIDRCPQVQSLPERGLPPTLSGLAFQDCHPTLTEQLLNCLDETEKRSLSFGDQ